MGNSLVKFKKAKWVDGGFVKELPTTETGDESQPPMMDQWGVPIKPPKDYDTGLVKKLIRQRRLAPFYLGFEDEQLEPLEPAEPAKCNEEVAAEESADESSGSASGSDSEAPTKVKPEHLHTFKKNKPNMDDPKAEEAAFFKDTLLKQNLVECPICLLSYPRNINYTECCKQPLCTTCFVKIKRPTSGRVISCPFCNYANFAVVYHKPRWLAELAKPESERDSTCQPDPVAAESLKLLTAHVEQIQRQRQAQQRQQRYYYVRNGSGAETNAPRRYVFYEPSGSYTFYDTTYYRTPYVANPQFNQLNAHRQQQQYQQSESLERTQLSEAIRQSLLDSSRAAEEYARTREAEQA